MRTHVTIFLFIIILLSLSGLYLTASWLLPQPSPPTAITLNMGGQKLNIASDLFLSPPTKAQAAAHLILLRVSYPALTAPTTQLQAQDQSVILHITAADPSLDPADRASTLYPRFLSPKAHTNEQGLRVQDFEEDSAYAGETLYVAPPEGRVFAARCLNQERAGKILRTSCIFNFRIKTLDVEARFSPDLLQNWQDLAQKLRSFVDSLVVSEELKGELR